MKTEIYNCLSVCLFRPSASHHTRNQKSRCSRNYAKPCTLFGAATVLSAQPDRSSCSLPCQYFFQHRNPWRMYMLCNLLYQMDVSVTLYMHELTPWECIFTLHLTFWREDFKQLPCGGGAHLTHAPCLSSLWMIKDRNNWLCLRSTHTHENPHYSRLCSSFPFVLEGSVGDQWIHNDW